MRERLTISFAIVMLLLVSVAGLVRGFALDGSLRERASEDIITDAQVLAALLSDREGVGQAIDQRQLDELTNDRRRVEFITGDAVPLISTGDDFVMDGSVSASLPVANGVLTLRASPVTTQQAWSERGGGIILLFGLMAVVAGLCGFLIARYLASPFRQLATAAAALGRGRFDLDLPSSSVPEARAIARALENSASLLRDRIEREQQFAAHASHELRTLLTRLRFELEELSAVEDAGEQAQQVATACLQSVDKLNAVAGELVELSRRGALMTGSEIPLRDLATESAQLWADRLAAENRQVSAAVEGEIDLVLTPGPVEQVLDLLLTDVVRHGDGDVRLVFQGAATSIRVGVTCVHASGVSDDESRLVAQAKAAVETLGGRFESVEDGHRMTVLLPRR